MIVFCGASGIVRQYYFPQQQQQHNNTTQKVFRFPFNEIISFLSHHHQFTTHTQIHSKDARTIATPNFRCELVAICISYHIRFSSCNFRRQTIQHSKLWIHRTYATFLISEGPSGIRIPLNAPHGVHDIGAFFVFTAGLWSFLYRDLKILTTLLFGRHSRLSKAWNGSVDRTQKGSADWRSAYKLRNQTRDTRMQNAIRDKILSHGEDANDATVWFIYAAFCVDGQVHADPTEKAEWINGACVLL